MLATATEPVHLCGVNAFDWKAELAGQFKRFFERLADDLAHGDFQRQPATRPESLKNDMPPPDPLAIVVAHRASW